MRCGACALVYSDPPQRAEVVRSEYDSVYERGAVVARMEGRRLAVVGDFFERVRPEAGARLLDVGCGTGDFLALARARGWQPTGIDLSARAAALARERGLDARTDWEGLSAGDFDAVTLWNVVEFLERPIETLRDVHRVLAPGGHVFIRTPNERFQLAAYHWRRRLAWCRPLARLLGNAYYFQPVLWSSTTLATALARAGFVEVRLWNSRPSAGDPYRVRSRPGEAAVDAAKRLVHACARGTGAATHGRVLVGSSLSALARKAA